MSQCGIEGVRQTRCHAIRHVRDRRSLTLVNQDQAKVVSCRVFLVDFAECGSKVKTSQEEADGYCLAYESFKLAKGRGRDNAPIESTAAWNYWQGTRASGQF